MAKKPVALIVGVGPGLGAALARRFATAGMDVAVAARDIESLRPLARELSEKGAEVRAYGCDATEETDVESLFSWTRSEIGEPDLVVYNAGSFRNRSILDLERRDFEDAWRINCLGGFLVGRAAARIMAPRGHGTILFTGATASKRGGAGFAPFAVGKFGLRALAESMARELGPKGVHVAHVIIDGLIDHPSRGGLAPDRGPDAMIAPDALAETYYALHTQPRSAWTFEIDVRPWVERF